MSPSSDSITVAHKHKSPCIYYSKGRCNRGDKCRNSHDMPSSPSSESDYQLPQPQSHERPPLVSSASPSHKTSDTRSKPKRKVVRDTDNSPRPQPQSPLIPSASLSQGTSDTRSKPKRGETRDTDVSLQPQRQSYEDPPLVSSASPSHKTSDTRPKHKRKEARDSFQSQPKSPLVSPASLSHETSDTRSKLKRKETRNTDHSLQLQDHGHPSSVSPTSPSQEISDTHSKPKRKAARDADHSLQPQGYEHPSSVSPTSPSQEVSDTRSKPKRKEARDTDHSLQPRPQSPLVSPTSPSQEISDTRSKPKRKETRDADHSLQPQPQSHEHPSSVLPTSPSHKNSDTRSKPKRKEILQVTNPSQPEHQSRDSPLVSPAGPSHETSDPKSEIPCKFWPNCQKGSKCPYKHDIDGQKRSHKQTDSLSSVSLQTVDSAAEPPSYAELVQERKAEVARERDAAISTKEASKTIIQLVCGSIVTYRAGLDVSRLITGFEACTLRVRNLPFDVTEDDIRDFLRDHSGGVHRSHVTVKKKSGLAEALVVTDIATGRELSTDSSIEFQDETISVEMSATNAADGTKAAAGQGSEIILSISWPAPPAASYVVEYADIAEASAKVKKLDGCHYEGRPIQVTMNSQPSNRFVPNLPLNSIRINNLPASVTDRDVTLLSGAVSVKRIRANPSGTTYTMENIIRLVQEDIQWAVPGGPEEFHAPRTCNKKGIYYAHAHFSSWDDAHAAYTRLSAQRYGNLSIRFYLPMHLAFDIPLGQYNAQKGQWDSLVGSIKAKKACTLDVSESGKVVNIRLTGPVKETTGALKTKVKNLGRGECVQGWHRAFAHTDNLIVPRVYSKTGAYLRVDSKQRSLSLCGMPGNIDRARKMIKSELESLDSLDYTVTLERHLVGLFVREGIQQLKETLGEDGVRFTVTMSSRKLTVSGGKEAIQALDYVKAFLQKRSRHLPNVARGRQLCPICYDTVSSPRQKLVCGHTYCTACLRHFISSALESDELPLTCLGNQTMCRVPIAIATIEQFLPSESFIELQEAALDAYIVGHREYQRCKTPNCTQVYRAASHGAAPQTLQCPSCLCAVCNGCHEDAHLGLSCAENEIKARESAEQERRNEARVASKPQPQPRPQPQPQAQLQGRREKKCPRCSVQIEKPDGGTHMTCRCGAYICLRCMRAFTTDAIHDHMRTSHGIPRDVPAVPAPAKDDNDIPDDPEEQRELMREALEYRRATRNERKREAARIERPGKQIVQQNSGGRGCAIM